MTMQMEAIKLRQSNFKRGIPELHNTIKTVRQNTIKNY